LRGDETQPIQSGDIIAREVLIFPVPASNLDFFLQLAVLHSQFVVVAGRERSARCWCMLPWRWFKIQLHPQNSQACELQTAIVAASETFAY
jgi:hypothetical protein